MWIYEWHPVAALSAKFAIKNPVGVSRRSESVLVSCVAIAMIVGAEATAWPASRISPNAANASGLREPASWICRQLLAPGDDEAASLPVNQSCAACVKRACAWLGSEVKVPRLPLKLDVGLWIVTVPFIPYCDEALTYYWNQLRTGGW